MIEIIMDEQKVESREILKAFFSGKRIYTEDGYACNNDNANVILLLGSDGIPAFEDSHTTYYLTMSNGDIRLSDTTLGVPTPYICGLNIADYTGIIEAINEYNNSRFISVRITGAVFPSGMLISFPETN